MVIVSVNFNYVVVILTDIVVIVVQVIVVKVIHVVMDMLKIVILITVMQNIPVDLKIGWVILIVFVTVRGNLLELI